MTLEKQVISLEIAKRLKELGVAQESLFYFFGTRWSTPWSTPEAKNISPVFQLHEKGYIETRDWYWIEDGEIYSAFTVAELGEMLPLANYSRRHTEFLGEGKTEERWSCGMRITDADTEADIRLSKLIIDQ